MTAEGSHRDIGPDSALDPDLDTGLERGLWPAVVRFCETHAVAGIAVAVVRGDEVATRTFGVRDLRTGDPVTDESMFHLASVSKPFVATAVVSLSATGALDLDAPVTTWVPELVLADGRHAEVTPRALLSHTSGLPDVTDYGWHEPQVDDDALSAFASSLSHWSLRSEPGTTFSYSNAGYELLGLVISRVTETTFETAMRQLLLAPVGMTASTFLRREVPAGLATSPHVGMPLTVPGDAYPYTRRHAPSSTLHSNLVEMSRWVRAHWNPDVLEPSVVGLLSEPVVEIGEPPWEVEQSLGWAVGSYAGQRTLSHSGADPGFGTRLVLVPGRRTGVVVLANSNTVFTSAIASTALDVALGVPEGDPSRTPPLDELLPPVAVAVAESAASAGLDEAAATFRELVQLAPDAYDLDDEEFEKCVWGAIELHRTDLVWPLLLLWSGVRPDSSAAWTMTGWAHQVDGDLDRARTLLRRALELDPDNEEAALLLGDL